MNWNPGTEPGRAGTKKGKKPTMWKIIHGFVNQELMTKRIHRFPIPPMLQEKM